MTAGKRIWVSKMHFVCKRVKEKVGNIKYRVVQQDLPLESNMNQLNPTRTPCVTSIMLLRRKRKCMIPIGRERAAENSCSLLPSLPPFPREWILYVNKCGGVGRKKCGQCHSKQVATQKNNQTIELRKENTSFKNPPKWRQNAINYVAGQSFAWEMTEVGLNQKCFLN